MDWVRDNCITLRTRPSYPYDSVVRIPHTAIRAHNNSNSSNLRHTFYMILPFSDETTVAHTRSEAGGKRK